MLPAAGASPAALMYIHRVIANWILCDSKCVSSCHRVTLDEHGVCSECHAYEATTSKTTEVASEKLRVEFKQFVQSFVGQGASYDALVLFSGGKYSTYMLHKLKTEFPQLRVLAVTISHEFLSATAVETAQRIVRKLDVEHLVIRPQQVRLGDVSL